MTTLVDEPKHEASSVLDTVIDVIRPYAKSNPDALDGDARLDKIGVDSFDFVEIVFKIEETYGVEIDYNANATFAHLSTVGDLAREVSARIAAKTAA